MRWTWLADAAVPLLDAVSVGAWVAAAGALLETGVAGRSHPWDALPYAVAAAMGIAWIRRPHAGGVSFIGLAVILAGAWLAAGLLEGAGTDGLRPFDPGAFAPDRLSAQPAGWLAALAVLLGTRHRRRAEDDETILRLLTWGSAILVVPWVAGVQSPEPLRTAFVTTAFGATVLFVAAGLLALGLGRLEALSATAPVSWRRNRAWLVLLGIVVLGVAVIAIPAAFLLGQPVTSLLGGTTRTLALVLSPVASALAPILAAILGVLNPLIEFLQSLMRARSQPAEPGVIGGSGVALPPQAASPGAETAFGVLVVALAVIAVLAIVAWLSRQSREREPSGRPAIAEEHHVRLPPIRLGRRAAARRPRRIDRPVTAAEAYVAFLQDVETDATLARRPTEGPTTHAGRLRAEAPALDPTSALLAADYVRETYAGRPVTPAETRRALSRWRRLRLLSAPASPRTSRPGPAASPDSPRP